MQVTEEMVSRFLMWRLPEDFCPDGLVRFSPYFNGVLVDQTSHHWPTGTNLMTATQARAMLAHVLGSASAA